MSPSPTPETPAGVVLAGGAGRRMGRDKALLRLAGGTTLIECALDALRAAGLPEVAISVSSADRVAALRAAIPALRHVSAIVDDAPDRGPLAGLHAALRRYEGRPVVLLACDMPRVDAAALRLLLGDYDAGMDVVIPRVAGHLQPLHARYGPACLPVAARLLREERLAMRGLLDAPGLRVCVLDDGLLARYGIAPCAFDNANAPADLAALGIGGE